MKTTLYMAITANGMIACKNGDSDWVSAADTKSFEAICKKIGAVVIGYNTYQVLGDDGILDGVLYVVLTHKNIPNEKPNVLFISQSPKDTLLMLESKGYKGVLIAGGADVNAQFLKEKLVDEIYLDVEPLIIGDGIPLFKEGNFDCELKLIETKKLSSQTVQLHYKVLK